MTVVSVENTELRNFLLHGTYVQDHLGEDLYMRIFALEDFAECGEVPSCPANYILVVVATRDEDPDYSVYKIGPFKDVSVRSLREYPSKAEYEQYVALVLEIGTDRSPRGPKLLELQVSPWFAKFQQPEWSEHP